MLFTMALSKGTVAFLIIFFHEIIFTVSSIQYPIDLTWEYDNQTAYWPTTQKFIFTRQISEKNNGKWYASNDFIAGEHCGTHFDAPFHFNENGWKTAEVPVDRLIVPGITVNLKSETENNNANATLKVQHLIDWETENGPIPNGSVILVQFGWSKYFHDHEKYFGSTGTDISALKFPGIDPEAAEWIVKNKKVFGVGIDTASIDSGANSFNVLLTHRILLKENIYALENVKIPDDMPAKGFTLLVMPMKIAQGTGAPCRIVAIPPVGSNC